MSAVKLTTYDIVVYTGDKRGAGTDAQVYVTLVGIYGDQTEKLHLKDSNNKKPFEKNQADKFSVKGDYIGELTKLRVEHDNSGRGPGWFLDRIVVTDLNDPRIKYTGICNRWLAKDEDDKQIYRDLILKKETNVTSPTKQNRQYKITVYTGNKKGAGTDANVFIHLYGNLGETGAIKLDNKKNNFESGKKDEFTIECPAVGEINKILIGHDNKGLGAAWFLDRVIVEDPNTRRTYEFLCNRWLAKNEDDGQISRFLFPKRSTTPQKEPTPGPTATPSYEITVFTGDKKGAGTDSQVYITLFGNHGQQTEKIHLNNSNNKNPFEHKQVDKFTVKSEYIGHLNKLRIEHDNSGRGPGWFLDKILVTDLHDSRNKYVAVCNRWLAKDEDDKQIARDLILNRDTGAASGTQNNNQYKIIVFTGKQKGAGTDANVFIHLYGNLGQTGAIKLDNKKNNFESGQKDEFTIECSSVGRINKILIEHDNKGLGPAWFLDSIIVEDVNERHAYEFPCNRWLAKNEDDGQISRFLIRKDSAAHGREPTPGNSYEITVYTGDKNGAGTDSQVYVTLFGNHGQQTEKIHLNNSNNKNPFEHKQVDKFTVKSEYIGHLNKLRIEHDNSGRGPGWFLDKILVTDLHDPRNKYIAVCNRWLAKDEDDKQIARDLILNRDTGAASGTQNNNQYKIIVHTGNHKGAGTDANVYIHLYGNLGETGAIKLDNKKNNFESGQKDEFTIECSSVGRINKILIGHDNKGLGPAWFLDSIIVEDVNEKHVYEFPCNRWLAKNEDDGEISRFLFPKGSTMFGKEPVAAPSYEITVFTGDKNGAGTDSQVYVTLFGNYGEQTEKIHLNNSNNKNPFEHKQVDKFTVKSDYIGHLNKLRIEHDNSGRGPGWFLDKILVTDLHDPRNKYIAVCNRWLAKDEDDKQIARDLILNRDTGAASATQKNNQYKIIVFTGKEKGAGTDANVFIHLYGNLGETDAIKLDNKKNNFESGQKDEFTIECQSVGRINKILIGHDNKGLGPAWFLDSIIIEDVNEKHVYEFPCNRWLAKNEDDGQISRFLIPKDSAAHGREPTLGNSYEITVFTGDKKGAGTDSQVYVTLFGNHGEQTEKIHLNNSNNKNPFEHKQVDKFTVKSDYIGHLNKLRIEHDNSGRGPGWFLDKILVTDLHDPRNKYVAVCNRWLAKDEDDKQIARDLILNRDTGAASGTQNNNQYKITVYTGNQKGAGTDANVFIHLYGNLGETGAIKLDNKKNNFESGQKDEFTIECSSVGEINKILIGHDNKGLGPAWFLDRVFVEDLNTRHTYEFPCNRWLAKDEDDKQTSRFLLPKGSSTHGGEHTAAPSYEITVFTGDKKGAGTDSQVYVTLFGNYGQQTEKIHLNNSNNKNPFEHKQVDKFIVKSEYIGHLNKLRIEHDNSGRGPGWFLDKILVTDLHDPRNKYMAVCNRWLAKDEDDKQIARDLILNRDTGAASGTQNNNQYKIIVHTGNHKGAGTDANVYIHLYGNLGETGAIKLDNKKNNFESGQKDEFTIECSSVGRINKILIGHDNKGLGPAWFLDSIIVEDVNEKHVYEFPCNRWLAKNEDDGEISRFLIPKDSAAHGREPTPGNSYEITVYTGDKKGAGTDSQVYITLFGNYGQQTEKIHLNNSNNKNPFEHKQVDKFTVKSEYIGHLNKLRIEHDNSGRGPGWFLDKILVTDLHDPRNKYVAVCNRWLAKDEDDKQIARDLILNRDTGGANVTQKNNQYKIIVYTGNHNGAGTDANVFIHLYGNLGETGAIKLDNKKNNFESGQKDEFTIECPAVGEINKILIGHDNKGLGAAWFLDRVFVEDLNTRHTYEFPCNRWLAKNEDDGEISRFLFPKGSTIFGKEPVAAPSYEITVYTGDKKGAGTDSQVYVTLFGNHGQQTEKIHLNNSNNKNPFEHKQVDKFTVKSEYIGHLNKLRIEHDNSGRGPGWFLDKIVVTDLHDPRNKYVAVCNRWLAKDEDDKQIARDLILNRDNGGASATQKNNQYKIIVYTGVKRGSGTDANVFIGLYGSLGETGAIMLDNKKNNFESGQKDEFTIECPGVGEINKILIGHDNKGLGPAWFLDGITIEDVNERYVYEFPCNQWLAKDEDDGQISRFLVPKGAAARGRELTPGNSYEITVFTGDKKGAGTDSQVFITLYGDHGLQTGKIHLNNSNNKNPFEHKQVDKFTVKSDYIGHLNKLRIEHDNSGRGPGWFLDKILITDLHDPRNKYIAVCNRWLAKDEDDKQISRDLILNRDTGAASATQKNNQYKIIVFTGKQKGAGTDANVFINLFGNLGETDGILLDNKKNNFESGQKDEFTIECPSVGRINKILIGHDNKGLGPAWFLDSIIVEDVNEKHVYEFPCNRWLAKNEDDGQISRFLIPKDSAAHGREPTPGNSYEITVYTGDKRGAGTDSQVYVTLFGNYGQQTEKIHLNNSNNKNPFEHKQVDKFTVKSDYIGHLNKLRIEHDNSGRGPGWFLDKILITDLHDPRNKYVAICNRWLAKDEDDKQISRDLILNRDTGAASGTHNNNQYKIVVYTGNHKGAGTDANVFLNIYGNLGETGAIKLDNKKNNFESGHKDEFTLECPSVGEIYKILIGHDNKGLGPGWFLDGIIIEDVNKNHVYEFPCNRWLSKDEDDKQISRVLLPKKLDNYEEEETGGVPYIITVYTGDKRDAGTDALVYIVMHGQGSRRNKILLNEGKFERKSIDKYTTDCPDDLCPLTALDIGHDNSGIGPGWYLDKVTIKCSSKGITQTFPCYNWLSANEGDRRIERRLTEDLSLRKIRAPSSRWCIWIYTFEIKDSSIDDQVNLVLYGYNGKSKDIKLKSKLESSYCDRYEANITDIGTPFKLRVSYQSKKAFALWHLDRIEMENLKTNEHYKFRCGKWLSKIDHDKQSIRELSAEGPGISRPLPVVKYTIEVYTGNKPGAGTDANVFIHIFGEMGDTGIRPLEHSLKTKNKFEKNQVDIFIIESVLLKQIEKIRIGHDGTRPGAGWFLDKVIIHPEDKSSQPTTFNCNRWLAVDEDDGLIIRELTTSNNSNFHDQTLYRPSIPYLVKVYTADVEHASCDCDVSLKLFGTTGSSKEIIFKKENENFEQSVIDTFQCQLEDVGKPIKLRVTLLPKFTHGRNQWYLEKIELYKQNQNRETFVFQLNDWIARETNYHADIPLGKGGLTPMYPTTYHIITKTSDLSDASCDSNVFIIISGENGDSVELELKHSPIHSKKFQRDHEDLFIFENIPSLNQLHKLYIWLDDSIFRNTSWHLEYVRIDDIRADKSYTFPCHKWLSAIKDDRQIGRELYCNNYLTQPGILSSPRDVQYQIVITTSDKQNAGTIQHVWIIIQGSKTKSERLLMKNTQNNEIFREAQRDTFTFQCQSLGQLQKIILGLQEKSEYPLKRYNGQGDMWHAQHITITDLSTGATYQFPVQKWININSDGDVFQCAYK